MPIYFRSIRSSSKGNCLAVFTDNTRILVDVGLSSMKKTREGIAEVYESVEDIDGVVISHTHSDHVSYYPLRVLAENGVELNVHKRCAEQLECKHFTGAGLGSLKLKLFDDNPFEIGDLTICPFEVSHNPYYPTFGFSIIHDDKKIVIATDLNSFDGVFENFLDADMIFIESNHDLELLEQYYNPNSLYHLPNPLTAKLIEDICDVSTKMPRVVMLGHISPQRNTPKIAIEEIRTHFESRNKKMEFKLIVAPLTSASGMVTV